MSQVPCFLLILPFWQLDFLRVISDCGVQKAIDCEDSVAILRCQKSKTVCYFICSHSRTNSLVVREIREKQGTITRKLIGHSGPVYGLSFEPSGGAATPPRFLLSASADGTSRLWSLDTMSNVVVYRGHSKPIWDVTWSPRGVYFATGSRDHTARLWTSDRVSPLRIFAGHLSDVDVG